VGALGPDRATYIKRLRAIPENLAASSIAGDRAANIRYKNVIQSIVTKMNRK
jgi:hypothetical protein